MTEIEKLKKQVKELQEKIDYYEGLPTAEFYTSVVEGMKHISKEIKNKTLDMESDIFAKSIFSIAKDADKVMSALGKGVEFFKQAESNTPSKKQDKSNTISF